MFSKNFFDNYVISAYYHQHLTEFFLESLKKEEWTKIYLFNLKEHNTKLNVWNKLPKDKTQENIKP